MKLIIDVDDTLVVGDGDKLPVWGDTITVVCPNGVKLTGRIDGWKHDGRTSKRQCGTYHAARIDQ